jgi:uncharacterized protein YtpQ (UPF0354 family)
MGRKRQWWLHNDVVRDFGELDNKSQIYCLVKGNNIHDSPEPKIYFFKNESDAYKFVCEYLTQELKKWKQDIDERKFDNWKNLSWRLNYGSGDGPTYYELKILPINFEYE